MYVRYKNSFIQYERTQLNQAMMNTTLERGQTTTARDQVSRNWSQWQPPQQNGKQTQNENDIMEVITHHSS